MPSPDPLNALLHNVPSHAPVQTAIEPFVPNGVMASVPIAPPETTDSAPPEASDPNAASLHPLGELPDAERALAASLSPLQRAGFVAGRRALRAALRAVAPDQASTPLLRTARGAPLLPEGFTGSISHKRARAVALAAPAAGMLVGIDLEERPRPEDTARRSIADRILTASERDAIASLDELAHREATLVRFALKEAVYKAIDPYVGRYVRFTEVELDVHDDGIVDVRLFLPEPQLRAVHVTAHWQLDERWIVAIARSVARG